MGGRVSGRMATILALLVALCPGPLMAGLADVAIPWSSFAGVDGYTAGYTDGGAYIRDEETSADATTGGPSASPSGIDLSSGATGLGPGPEVTPTYGYTDGGTPYDPADPSSYADDHVFFRFRLAGDPAKSAAFDSYHWNILLDVDNDGYKEYWVDVEGSFASGGDKSDRVRILYDNETTQLVSDDVAALVDQYTARNTEDVSGHPENHTRSFPVGDGSGDYFLDLQIPLTAFRDLNGNQVVFPNSPISFAFSTGSSNQDPLQKDWSSDFGDLSAGWTTSDPINFGDIVRLNGEATVEFVDAFTGNASRYAVGDGIYVLVTDRSSNLNPAVADTITVYVTHPDTGGDDELLVLTETGPDTGVFINASPLASSSTPGTDNDGTIEVVAGDQLLVTYIDPDDGDTDPNNNVKQDIIDIVGSVNDGYVQFTRSTGFDVGTFTYKLAPDVPESDLVYVTVTDANVGASSLTVTIVDLLTGDSETLVLQETSPGSGIFRNGTGFPTQIKSGAITPDDGILEGQDGSTLVVYYVDSDDGDGDSTNDTKTDTANIYVEAAGRITFEDNGGYDKDGYAIQAEGIFLTVEDYNNSASSSVTVTVTDSITGDTETLTLYATRYDATAGAGSGIFTNRPTPPVDQAPSASISSPVVVEPGVVRYETWTVTYVAATSDWTVSGSTSGVQAARAADGLSYVSDDGSIRFIIDESVTPADGESFTFTTYPVLPTSLISGTGTEDGILATADGSILTATYVDEVGANGSDDGDGAVNDPSNDAKIDTALARELKVVIDEVLYDPSLPDGTSGFEFIRLVNASPTSVTTVTNYSLSDEDGAFTYTIPTFGGLDIELAPGEEVVIVLADGVDAYDATAGLAGAGRYVLYAGASVAGTLGTTEDQVSLYDSPTKDWSTIVDFVAWDEDTDASDWLDDDNNAVAGEIWTSLNYFSVASPPSGVTTATPVSIWRTRSGFDTDRPSDWSFNPNPTAITAVELLWFRAAGAEGRMVLRWKTASERDNVGFHLYKASSPEGPWKRLPVGLIPSRALAPAGAAYFVEDPTATPGEMAWYLLEDVEFSGLLTRHGPVGSDWDDDGMEDAWELAHGFDPADARDAEADADGDGLSNLVEFWVRLNPRAVDSDGDGYGDGAFFDLSTPEVERADPVAALPRGGLVLVESGPDFQTYELETPELAVARHVEVGGRPLAVLEVPTYPHGMTRVAGAPTLPLKGKLIELPPGREARVEIVEVEEKAFGVLDVAPAPYLDVDEDGRVHERFERDPAVWASDELWPAAAARILPHDHRARQLRLLFHPVALRPATGELLLRRRLRVRLSFVPSDRPVAALQTAPWIPPAGSAKLRIASTGMVSVSASELATAGLACLGASASELRAWVDGQEIALHVLDGGDGVLHSADRIEFFIEVNPDKVASHRVAFLSLGGGGLGLRVSDRANAAGAPQPVSSLRRRVRREENAFYWAAVPGAEEDERWFDGAWIRAFPGAETPTSYGVSVDDPVSGGEPARLRIRLAPLTDREEVEPDHWISVSVAGTPLVSTTFDGLEPQVIEADCPQDLLSHGTVSVDVGARLFLASPRDILALDWIEVDYRAEPRVRHDRLLFELPDGTHRLTLDGFVGDDADCFDVSDPRLPRRLAAVSRGSGLAGRTLSFDDEGARRYWVGTSAARIRPVAIEAAVASADVASAAQADLIVVAPSSFHDALLPLITFRAGMGMRSRLVTPEQIYELFSGGRPSVEALRSYLAWALEGWTPPAPRYVLLVGDGSVDPRNHLGLTRPEGVPVPLAWTPTEGEVPSDVWYADCVGSDGVPDLVVGRLPARTIGDVQAMVAKILTYETRSDRGGVDGTHLVVNDNEDPVFTLAADELSAAIAATGPWAFDRVDLKDFPLAAPAAERVRSRLEAGCLMVSFVGHGAVDLWADEMVLSNATVDALAPAPLLPVVVSMACFDGYFGLRDGADCLAERLVKGDGTGAVAVLACSSTSSSHAKRRVHRALTHAVFGEGTLRLGDAFRSAQLDYLANGVDAEAVLPSLNFFGDPTMTLASPAPRPPSGVTVFREGGGALLRWTAAPDGDVVGYHVYRAWAEGAVVERITSTPVVGTSYLDGALGTTASAVYTLRAVDADGFMSGSSASAALTAPLAEDGGGGGGCSMDRRAPPSLFLGDLLLLILPFLLLRFRR